jgi:hypothetical protein
MKKSWLLYRTGVWFKDLGERLRWVGLIRLGLRLRDTACNSRGRERGETHLRDGESAFPVRSRWENGGE